MDGALGHELPVFLLDKNVARKAIRPVFVESFFKSVCDVAAKRRAKVQVFSSYLNGHFLALFGRSASVNRIAKRFTPGRAKGQASSPAT
jgi:hypothetical protein